MGDLQTQWQAVKDAPFLYGAALVAIILIVWGVVHFLYRHRIDGLKEELDRERRENDRLRLKGPVGAPAPKAVSTPPKPAKRDGTNSLPIKHSSPVDDAHRMFVGGAVTPKYFDDLFDEHTEHQANKLIAPYLGKWMRVSGVVSTVKHENEEWHVTIKTHSEIVAETTILSFDEREGDRIELLHKGDSITVEGRIEAVNSVWLRLEDCRIV